MKKWKGTVAVALGGMLACIGLIGCSASVSSAEEKKTPLWDVPDYTSIPHGSTLTAENTGVPDGHTLVPVTEDIRVTEEWITDENNGSRVIENKNFASGAGLTIEAGDFTVRYCKFNGVGGIYLPYPVMGILIQDCEFDGNQENGGSTQAIKNSAAGIHLLRLHVHHWPRALTVVKGNTIVENCYMHDLTSDDSGAHIENIYVAGGSNHVYAGNYLEANPVSINPDQDDFAVSASLAIYNQGADYEDLDSILVERNYITGIGSYAFYGGASAGKSGPFATNILVRGNVFGREHMRKGGLFGPVTSFDEDGPGNSWENNTWGPRGPYWVSGDPEEGDPVVLP